MASFFVLVFMLINTNTLFLRFTKLYNIPGAEHCNGTNRGCDGKCYRLKRDQNTDKETCLSFTENREGK